MLRYKFVESKLSVQKLKEYDTTIIKAANNYEETALSHTALVGDQEIAGVLFFKETVNLIKNDFKIGRHKCEIEHITSQNLSMFVNECRYFPFENHINVFYK